MTSDSQAPLAGIRVLDLTIALAGPYGTRILADLGAEVIKVDTRAERNYATQLDLSARLQAMYPNADPGEESWNAGGFHGQLNRNKKSVALELGTEEGRAAFLQLVKTADCLVENFTPKVMPSLGLGYDALRVANPKLVYVAMPGYGMTGPHSGFPAFAPTTEATAGFLSAVGYEDGTLVPNPMSLGDFVGGLNAVTGLLAALWASRESGEGALVDLSQVEAMATFMGERYTGEIPMDGEHPANLPSGNRIPGALISGIFPARGFDEWIAISIYDEQDLGALSNLAGRPWGADPSAEDLATTEGQARLRAAIGEWTRQFAKQELAERLQAAGLAAGAVQTAPDLLADAQLNHLGFFLEIDNPGVGPFPYEGQPWHFSDWPGRLRRPAPRAGEHTTSLIAQSSEASA